MSKPRNWLLGILISVAALTAAFWGVQPERFVEALAAARYAFLVPVLGLLLVGLLARARSWQILMGGSVGFRRSFSAMNEGYLLNNVLPFRLGEVARAYVVSRGGHLRGGAALATVLVERLLDIAITLAGLVLALANVTSAPWASKVAWTAGLTLVVACAAVMTFAFKQDALSQLADRMPFLARWGLRERIDHFAAGLSVVRRPESLLAAGSWSLLAWGTTWLQILIYLRMFGRDGSLPEALFVSGVVAFGAALPSSPGAVGVYELSTVAALLVFAVPKAEAVSIAVLAHGFQLVVIGLLGGWALARDGESVLGLAAQARTFLRSAQSATSA